MTQFNETFGYDSLNRLTSAAESSTGWSRGFSYDLYGNMSVTQNANAPLSGLTPLAQNGSPYNAANNQLLGGVYDAAGNQSMIGLT